MIVSLTTDGRRTHDAVADAVGCLTPAFLDATADPPALIRQLHDVTRNMKQLTEARRSP